MPLQMRKTLEELFSSCYSSHEAVKVPTAKAELRSWYSSDLGSSMQDEKALPQLGTYPAKLFGRMLNVY